MHHNATSLTELALPHFDSMVGLHSEVPSERPVALPALRSLHMSGRSVVQDNLTELLLPGSRL